MPAESHAKSILVVIGCVLLFVVSKMNKKDDSVYIPPPGGSNLCPVADCINGVCTPINGKPYICGVCKGSGTVARY